MAPGPPWLRLCRGYGLSRALGKGVVEFICRAINSFHLTLNAIASFNETHQDI